MKFSSDSAMTRSVAESLIEKRDLDIVDVAKRFVESYYQDPARVYGTGCIQVSNIVLAFIYIILIYLRKYIVHIQYINLYYTFNFISLMHV